MLRSIHDLHGLAVEGRRHSSPSRPKNAGGAAMIGHQVLVAPTWISDISWLEATVSVDLSRDAIKHAPAYDPDAPLDRDQEVRMHQHHARPGYWAADAQLTKRGS